MGLRSYVPQLGRFLQPDPIAGGSANAYAYTFGDPVNSSDPTGAYTMTITAFEIEHSGEQSQKVEENYMAEKRAAEEAAARQAAKEAAERAAELAAAAGGPQYAATEEWGPEEEWEEWWEEEEGEYEWATYHHGTEPASEEGHVEPAILIQPLLNGEEAGNGERATTFGSQVPLCQAEGQGPCAHLARGGEGTHKKHNYHHEVVPSGNVCSGIATAAYFVPGVGEVISSIRGAAGILFLGACG